MRSIHYIFVKAHGIANLKMLLKPAKTYLEEPKSFYETYFILDKEAALKSANTDGLIRKLVEAKSIKDEELYYSLIDYQER